MHLLLAVINIPYRYFNKMNSFLGNRIFINVDVGWFLRGIILIDIVNLKVCLIFRENIIIATLDKEFDAASFKVIRLWRLFNSNFTLNSVNKSDNSSFSQHQ